MAKDTFRDKILGLIMVALGMAFIFVMPSLPAAMIVGSLVILGGLLTIINSQVLGALMKDLPTVIDMGKASSAGQASQLSSSQPSAQSTLIKSDQAQGR